MIIRFCSSGFSLIEILIAILISATLMVAISSVILVSGKTLALPSSASAANSGIVNQIGRIMDELQTSDEITEWSGEKLVFTVQDRDLDGKKESITFEFNPTEQQLKKTLALSGASSPPDSVVLLSQIQSMSFFRRTSIRGQNAVDVHETDPDILWSNDDQPTPSDNRVLFAVKNSGTTLTTAESLKINWLTSNGYTVESLFIGESESNWTSALSRNDAVFLSNELAVAEIPDIVVQTALGLIFENSELAERMQMGKSVVTNSSNTLFIRDRYNVITDSSRTGSHIFATSEPELAGISEVVSEHSPDLEILGQSGSNVVMARMNQGAEAYSTSAANPGSFGSSLEHTNASNSSYLFKHVASRFELTQKARVKEIEARLLASDQSTTRFGIYSDNGGQPGSLLAQSLLLALVAATEPQWITGPLEQELVLPPGNYWIVAAIEDSTQFFFGASDGGACDGNNGVRTSTDTTVSIADGLLSSWPELTLFEFCEISLRANYEEISTVAGRRFLLPWKEAGFDYSSLSPVASVWLSKTLQWVCDNTPDDPATDYLITSTQTLEQYFEPTSPDASATHWKVTRSAIQIKPQWDAVTPTVRFQLFLANPDQTRSSTLVAQSDWISLAHLPRHKYSWLDIPLPTTPNIDISNGLFLVVSGQSYSGDATIAVDETSVSSNGGNTGPLQNVDLEGVEPEETATVTARLYTLGSFILP